MEKRGRLFSLMVLGVFVWFLASTGEAATTWPCACPGQTIQSFIDNSSVASGDTISVTGVCTENVIVRKSLTVDGNNTAEIHAAVSTTSTVQITTSSITVRNFKSIQGGSFGIYVTGTSPITISGNIVESTGNHGILLTGNQRSVIDSNTIQNAGGDGISVGANSYVTITNNTITNNAGNGIQLWESSAARIGFSSTSDTTASPNTITSNGGNGIYLYSASSARIVGNTISGNTGNGITIYRLSYAQISSNTIDGNGTSPGNINSGIAVLEGSGVDLGSPSGSGIFNSPNNTTVNNGYFGINLGVGTYVTGRIGTLNGVYGPIDNSAHPSGASSVGIKTSTLAGDYGIDVLTASDGIMRVGNTSADNTDKTVGMVLRHYNNAQDPVYLFGGTSTSASNSLTFGGGSDLGNAATQIDFYTAPNPITPIGTSRMTIASNGHIGIGTATPSQQLHVEGAPGGTALLFRAATTTDAAVFIEVPDLLTNTPNLRFLRAGATKWVISDAPADNSLRMSTTKNGTNLVISSGGDVGIGTVPPGGYKLYVNGITYSTGGYLGSDIRFKEHIASIDSALAKVMNIAGVSYTWKTQEFKEKGFPEGRHYGLIAQEVEKVLPGVVAQAPSGEKAVSYTELVPVLIQAMKEQQKAIHELSAEVKELKRELRLRATTASVDLPK